MRLLICTQAVDRNDPVLGFFHAWVERLAAHSGSVEVICLSEGEHALPQNVRVHSLGKERGRKPAWRYALRFIALAWRLRGTYDTVFVHMSQEYVLLAGVLWRLFGKRIVLWRNHKMGSLFTRLAGLLAHAVCYTSPSAYVAHYSNAVQMPVGIDTEEFKPGLKKPRSILFLGRLDAVKNVHVFVAALHELGKEDIEFIARMYGEPTEKDSAYAAEVRHNASSLGTTLQLHGAVTNAQAARLFASHAIYVNLTPSGSFDKTIGEAMASGCISVVANDVVRSVLPKKLFVDDISPKLVAEALSAALALPDREREMVAKQSRTYVEREHSLSLLMQKLIGALRP